VRSWFFGSEIPLCLSINSPFVRAALVTDGTARRAGCGSSGEGGEWIRPGWRQRGKPCKKERRERQTGRDGVATRIIEDEFPSLRGDGGPRGRREREREREREEEEGGRGIGC